LLLSLQKTVPVAYYDAINLLSIIC